MSEDKARMDENPYRSPPHEGGGLPEVIVRAPSSRADLFARLFATGGALVMAYIALRILAGNFGPYGYFELIRPLFWGMVICSAGLVVAAFGSRARKYFAPNAGMLLIFSGGFIYLLFF